MPITGRERKIPSTAPQAARQRRLLRVVRRQRDRRQMPVRRLHGRSASETQDPSVTLPVSTLRCRLARTCRQPAEVPRYRHGMQRPASAKGSNAAIAYRQPA